MSHVAVQLAISLRSRFVVLWVFGCDVDHGQHGLDNVALLFHFFFCLLQKQVGVSDVVAQTFDLFLSMVDGSECIELKLVIINYVLEI